jgi:hypothetical protein
MDSGTGDVLDEAAKARRLAVDARRIAELMHQVQVRRDLMAQAASLERQAEELERNAAARQRVSDI